MKTKVAKALLGFAVSLYALGVQAQSSYSIGWHIIGGGGGTSTGGVFAVSGTVGQLDANSQPMTNGNFSLTGGFWSLFAVQTAGGPLLSIKQLGTDVRIFWPLPATGFVLDQSLTATGTWSQVSFPYTTNATGISINVPAPTGNKFYRLRKM